MANKKSRKGGQIGIPKSTIPVVRAPSDRIKKKKGNKPGTRNSVEETTAGGGKNAKKDSRIGSKVPIDLLRHKKVSSTKAAEPVVKYNTPKDELDAIEADEKLQTLLDKQESKALSKLEKDYVETKLARHLVLCGLLGIDVEEESEEDDDPIAGLDAISIDDFTD